MEIALSSEHELKNVKKCLKEKFSTVQIVYVSERVKKKIEDSIREELGEILSAVLFSSVKDFK